MNKYLHRFGSAAIVALMAMGTAAPVFAEDPKTLDGSISVKGLQAGDQVTIYKFVDWEGGNWKVKQYTKDDGTQEDVISLDELRELSPDELAKIASHTDAYGEPVATGTVGDSGTYTLGGLTTDDKGGSYLVLVTDSTNNYVYNPIVVSNDYARDNKNEVDLGTDNEASGKREKVDIDKKSGKMVKGEADFTNPDYTVGADGTVTIGDNGSNSTSFETIPFEVSGALPWYNDNWTDPFFQITDTLTDGLTLDKNSVKVNVTGDANFNDSVYDLATTDRGYTVTFHPDYLKKVKVGAKYVITYKAEGNNDILKNIQVNQEDNTAKVEWSNNPKNSEDHGTRDDETHHYTFSIDGNVFSNGNEQTRELIKVGLKENGTEETKWVYNEKVPTDEYELEGATFTLTGKDGYTATAVTDEKGQMLFEGLKEGTYTLRETQAPRGYVADDKDHTVNIHVEYKDAVDPKDGSTSEVLKSYTITIDGKNTSTYTAVNDNNNPAKITDITPDASNTSTGIVNKHGTKLPSTGGIGTTIFTIVGVALMSGAVVLYAASKKREDRA